MSSYGNMCQETVPVVGFRVSGNRVRFGRFHGTIDSNDGLQMVSNQQWIVGQFEGATFHGQVTFWTREGPGCTYVLSLAAHQRLSAGSGQPQRHLALEGVDQPAALKPPPARLLHQVVVVGAAH